MLLRLARTRNPLMRLGLRSRHDGASLNVAALKAGAVKETALLPEVIQREKFQRELVGGLEGMPVLQTTASAPMSAADLKLCMDAAFLTFHLHVESRVASSLGYGYYTIGPCGEELMSAVALALRPTDASALHYRHVAMSVARQMMAGEDEATIALNRARATTCSILDPITAGKHCAIGGSPHDFYVTSTLASQTPPAVGRALGFSVAHMNKVDSIFPRDSVSFVSIGDGSSHNAHFLAAANLGDLAIAHKNKGWAGEDGPLLKRMGATMEIFRADGNDVMSVHEAAASAVSRARKSKKPTVLVIDKVKRRFGHAATDRQKLYLTDDEIADTEGWNNLVGVAQAAVHHGGMSYADVSARFAELEGVAAIAFEAAACEPGADTKGRAGLEATNSAPFARAEAVTAGRVGVRPLAAPALGDAHKALTDSGGGGRRDVMRKHMTKGLGEALENRPEMVYIGEDVEHGGYYVVTEGLKEKYPSRVRDFPPDETTLIGAAMGFSQCGLLPIVEIPYAKYLDCGFDMFNEAVMANWLTDGKQPNGMVIRLQGFDRGLFGGNFHTSNALPLPPGLDVMCFSNGHDWVRGLRLALDMAKAGRVVMMVDSTALLHRRHIDDGEKDGGMLTAFPSREGSDEGMSLGDVTLYCAPDGVFAGAAAAGADGKDKGKGKGKGKGEKTDNKPAVQKRPTAAAMKKAPKVAIVTYGNGVPLTMEAVAEMTGEGSDLQHCEFAIVDVPCLSAVPAGLRSVLDSEAGSAATHVVFADVCKEGAGQPLASHAVTLHNDGGLDGVFKWATVGASRTYNPLGSLVTFLSSDDIHAAVKKVVL